MSTSLAELISSALRWRMKTGLPEELDGELAALLHRRDVDLDRGERLHVGARVHLVDQRPDCCRRGDAAGRARRDEEKVPPGAGGLFYMGHAARSLLCPPLPGRSDWDAGPPAGNPGLANSRDFVQRSLAPRGRAAQPRGRRLLSAAVVGRPGEDRGGAVELLGEHDAGEHVRPDHAAEGKPPRRRGRGGPGRGRRRRRWRRRGRAGRSRRCAAAARRSRGSRAGRRARRGRRGRAPSGSAAARSAASAAGPPPRRSSTSTTRAGPRPSGRPVRSKRAR